MNLYLQKFVKSSDYLFVDKKLIGVYPDFRIVSVKILLNLGWNKK